MDTQTKQFKYSYTTKRINNPTFYFLLYHILKLEEKTQVTSGFKGDKCEKSLSFIFFHSKKSSGVFV